MNKNSIGMMASQSLLWSAGYLTNKPLPRSRKPYTTKPSIDTRKKRRRRRDKIAKASRKRNRGNS